MTTRGRTQRITAPSRAWRGRRGQRRGAMGFDTAWTDMPREGEGRKAAPTGQACRPARPWASPGGFTRYRRYTSVNRGICLRLDPLHEPLQVVTSRYGSEEADLPKTGLRTQNPI